MLKTVRFELSCIPQPVWAIGFALEQPLRDAMLACPAAGISKQLEHNIHQAFTCGQNLPPMPV
ncbi:MAG: hypothetical protein LBJ00_08410 [Planctomycetaceae bacterium]|nr:hypothetical protein [Planctomycetaceae bacterium]